MGLPNIQPCNRPAASIVATDESSGNGNHWKQGLAGQPGSLAGMSQPHPHHPHSEGNFQAGNPGILGWGKAYTFGYRPARGKWGASHWMLPWFYLKKPPQKYVNQEIWSPRLRWNGISQGDHGWGCFSTRGWDQRGPLDLCMPGFYWQMTEKHMCDRAII